MSLILTNTNKSTDIYKIENNQAVLYKNLTQANSVVASADDYFAVTTQDNVVDVYKYESGDVRKLCTFELGADVKAMQFSPKYSYIQVLTYGDSGDNDFVFSLETQA